MFSTSKCTLATVSNEASSVISTLNERIFWPSSRFDHVVIFFRRSFLTKTHSLARLLSARKSSTSSRAAADAVSGTKAVIAAKAMIDIFFSINAPKE